MVWIPHAMCIMCSLSFKFTIMCILYIIKGVIGTAEDFDCSFKPSYRIIVAIF
uniref:Uncharacterized protein n=1 Tax=Rhizophora mucronata TaxID=61149 RepID=A0A2P2P6R3_RHIMU